MAVGGDSQKLNRGVKTRVTRKHATYSPRNLVCWSADFIPMKFHEDFLFTRHVLYLLECLRFQSKDVVNIVRSNVNLPSVKILFKRCYVHKVN